MTAEPVIHEDGIYFGMPEEEYHPDRALGSTDHKELLPDPVQWQWGKLTELRESLDLGDNDREKSSAKAAGKEFGDAVDLLVTDRARFEATYMVAPDPPKPVLTTIQAIREDIIGGCDLPKAAKLYDIVQMAVERGLQTGMLVDDWVEMKAELLNGRKEISKRWMNTLLLIDKVLDMGRADYGGKSIREAVLAGGVGQVSVFWTDERGVRCKCRFDWLKVRSILDVKTYSARQGQEPVEAFWGAVANFCYDMQAEHYLEGRAKMRELWEAGRVFGDHDEAFLRKVCTYGKRPVWTWLAIRNNGFPETDVLQLPEQAVSAAAAVQVQAARTNFLEYSARFGPDEPWVSTRGPILMTDMSCPFPARIMSRGDQRWRLTE